MHLHFATMLNLLNFVAAVLFWGGLFALFYTYVGFALTLKLIRDIKIIIKAEDYNVKGINSTKNLGIQIIIPCFNEAKIIERRIENILTQNYLKAMLSVLVISDGSTDMTDEIIRRISKDHSNVVLFSIPNNVGKNDALNLAYESNHFTAPILCFTDADTEFEPGALASAARFFVSSKVGLIAGRIEYWLVSTSANLAEGAFWRLENFIREGEGNLGWLVSCPGQFIMMRRELFQPLPPDANTDFAMPLMVLAQGYAATFDQGAKVRSLFPSDQKEVLSRRQRTVIRALTTIAHYKHQLPWKIRFILFWHKTVRFYGFPLQVAILAANLILCMVHPSSFWSAILLLQVGFYGLAALGFLAEQLDWQLPLVHLPYQFTLQNAVALSAVISYLKGQRVAKWTPPR